MREKGKQACLVLPHTPYLNSLSCSSPMINTASRLLFSCTFPMFNIYSTCVPLYLLPPASSSARSYSQWLHRWHWHLIRGVFCLCSPHHSHPCSGYYFSSVYQCFFLKIVWLILCTAFTAKWANLELYIIQHANSQQLALLPMLGWANSVNITILHPYSTNFFAFNFSSYASQAEFFFCLDQPIHLSHPTPSSSKPSVFPTTFQTSTEGYIGFYHSLLTLYLLQFPHISH